MSDMELVVALGRTSTRDSSWEPIQEMVITPCPGNADAARPLELRIHRRQADTGKVSRVYLPLWADE